MTNLNRVIFDLPDFLQVHNDWFSPEYAARNGWITINYPQYRIREPNERFGETQDFGILPLRSPDVLRSGDIVVLGKSRREYGSTIVYSKFEVMDDSIIIFYKRTGNLPVGLTVHQPRFGTISSLPRHKPGLTTLLAA